MSLKHAILGFLSFKSLTGYGLKKAFDRSVRHFWPANQSQIYRELSALNEEGFVKQEVIEREERLDKKLYHITDAGRTELHRWLATPLPVRSYREPFLIQIYFGGRLSDQELISLLEHKIRATEERLEKYRFMYSSYVDKVESQDDPRAYFLSSLTLEFGLAGEQFTLEWLQNVVERVKSRDYRLRAFES
jgi:PadR family transcriptional regulator AphA